MSIESVVLLVSVKQVATENSQPNLGLAVKSKYQDFFFSFRGRTNTTVFRRGVIQHKAPSVSLCSFVLIPKSCCQLPRCLHTPAVSGCPVQTRLLRLPLIPFLFPVLSLACRAHLENANVTICLNAALCHLFSAPSGNFPMISDDLVNSYHLLLCALDLVITNALLCNARKELLNPDFRGSRWTHWPIRRAWDKASPQRIYRPLVL